VEETRTDGITILKWVLQEKNGTRRTRFAWHRLGVSVGPSAHDVTLRVP
jgi:hypothetical protein